MAVPAVPPKRKAQNDKLYRMFCDATRQLCSDLEMDYDQVRKDRRESASRSSYNAYEFGCKYPLTFSVLLDQIKEMDHPMLSVWIQIPYGEGSAPFVFEDYATPKPERRGDYLMRWVEYAAYKFHLKHEPANLNSRFAGAGIRVYGMEKQPDLTQAEMKIFINGIKRTPNDRITVYRFRHMNNDPWRRSYSYGFNVALRSMPYPFWVFFHGVGDTYPMVTNPYLKEIEKMTRNIRGSVHERFDIEYDTLHKYLQGHAVSFVPRRSGEMLFDLNEVPAERLKDEFKEAYSKFLQHLGNGDYPEALRGIRVLVQDMLEDICRENGVDMRKHPNINNLSQDIKSHGIIDNKIEALLNAFTPYPNDAAHRILPKDYTDDALTRNIIKTTILLGAQLITYMIENVKRDKEP